MLKNQLLLLGAGILLATGLYALPRVVVQNSEGKQLSAKETSIEEVHSEDDGHDHSVSESSVHGLKMTADVQQQVLDWSTALKEGRLAANDLDSLVAVYKKHNFYDSAAFALGTAAEASEQTSVLMRAGDAFLEASGYALSKEKAAVLSAKARMYYEKLLAIDPTDLEAKSMSAMTYVFTEEPMKAIFTLREVVEKDPKNRTALFNLGLLSLQSRQYDKAVGRFEELLTHYPEDAEIRFYLGLALFESGKTTEARPHFEMVMRSGAPAHLIQAAESYLQAK